jgi:hypothetical protein
MCVLLVVPTSNAFELIVLQSNTNAMKLGCAHSRKYETTSKEQKQRKPWPPIQL